MTTITITFTSINNDVWSAEALESLWLMPLSQQLCGVVEWQKGLTGLLTTVLQVHKENLLSIIGYRGRFNLSSLLFPL